MSEGIIAVKNTAPKYLKGAADQTIRGRFWLSYLQKEGRIMLGERSGTVQYWNVKARQPEVRANGDAGQQTFAEFDAYEQLNVNVRGYVATDRLTLKKELMNRDPLAIVDLYGTKIDDLLKSLRDSFGAELYVDGYATGNENRLIGINSFTGYDSNNTVAADIVAKPSDTYGGKSTALGNLGGSWSSDRATSPNANVAKDWPYGNGSSEYDYITPKLINWSSTGWGTNATDFKTNGPLVMRRAKTWCKSTGGNDMAPMCFLLGPDLYDDFLDGLSDRFRQLVEHKSGSDLGFADVINFEGAAVKHEFDCDATEGYGINVQEMSLFSIHDDFFYSYGPEWDTQSLSYLYLVGFFGNLRFNPKHFAKLDNYA